MVCPNSNWIVNCKRIPITVLRAFFQDSEDGFNSVLLVQRRVNLGEVFDDELCECGKGGVGV